MIQQVQKQTLDMGSIVVNGLFAGIGAGLLMAGLLALLTLTGLTSNPASILFAGSPLGAALVQHLAVAGVYGIVFTLGVHLLKRRVGGTVFIVLSGLLYGGLLGLVARYVVVPGEQIGAGGVPLGVLLGAHLMYGVVLGWFTQMSEKANLA